MPAKSEKQRKWAFANKGEKWAKEHHFDKVQKGGSKKGSRKRR